MRKNIKKFTAFIATVTLVFTLGVPAFAAEEKEVVELPAGWEIIDMSEIPEGVTPLYVDSVEEAYEIVNGIHETMLEREASLENVLPSSLSVYGGDQVQSKKMEDQ